LELATIKDSYLIWEASKVIRSSEKNPILFVFKSVEIREICEQTVFVFKSVEIRAFGLVPSMNP